MTSLHHVQQPGRRVAKIMRPRTLAAALQLLRDTEGARPVAGGTDVLLDLQRGGPGDDVTLLDLTGIPNFRSVIDEGDSIVLGGGVTHSQVVGDSLIREEILPLAQACLEVGSPQLRNRATIAGNLVTASPANDTISALLALDASVELSQSGAKFLHPRLVPVSEFFTGFRTTVIEPYELITGIHVPKLRANERGMWVKLGLRKAQAISVVHAGIVIGFAEDGESVIRARLAMGSVAPTVVLIDAFADALIGRQLTDESIRDAARAASAAVSPIDDVRATADYRSETIVPLITRTLKALAAGEQARMWPDDPPLLSSLRQVDHTPAPEREQIDDAFKITVDVNGEAVSGAGGASSTLLDWIRDNAHASDGSGALTGAKEGCAEGECGACTVVLNGSAVMSCLVAAAQADGATVVTVEGLGTNDSMHPIQQAFVDEFAVQCGFCIPGFIVAGARLLEDNLAPTDEQIELALSGNLCRCTGYYPIVNAVRRAGEAGVAISPTAGGDGS